MKSLARRVLDTQVKEPKEKPEDDVTTHPSVPDIKLGTGTSKTDKGYKY